MRTMNIFFVVSILLVFTGCTSAVFVGPGDKPDAVPPKIVLGADNNRIWDRPNAFGPVPAGLQEAGKKVCGPLGLKAIGYHPNAQDENGYRFPDGGYLCVPNK